MPQETYRNERYIDAMIALGLALLAALLYIPYLGSYPLWDPWEAHYSQVAMEMIHHNSWWEPWYRKSTTSFWSKPIFTFWLMVSSLKLFRINQVGSFAQAELYLRLPIAMMGAVGVGYVFFFVRRLWNRRTGVLAALVLATCPQYFLISRQVMVDIPFVVIQTIAMGFFALGLFDPRPEKDDEQERQFGIATFRQLGLVALGLQLAEWVYWRFRLLPQSDFGSLLTADRVAWATELSYWNTTMQQGSYLFLALAIFFFLWMFVRSVVLEPKTRFFYLFFFFSGIGFLAKGLLSIVIPGGAVLFYILLTRDWDVLRRMRLIYTSDKLNQNAATLLSVLASLAAIWFITFPMMVGLLQDPIGKMARSNTIKMLKRHQQERKEVAAQQRNLRQLAKLKVSLVSTPTISSLEQGYKQTLAARKQLRQADVRLRKARANFNWHQKRVNAAKRRKASKQQVDAFTKQATKARTALGDAQKAFNQVNASVSRAKAQMNKALRSIQAKTSLALKQALQTKQFVKQNNARQRLQWVSLWRKRIKLEKSLYNLRTQRVAKNEKLATRTQLLRGMLLYNSLTTVQGWYRDFGRLGLYRQIGWFAVFSLMLLALLVLLAGASAWEGAKSLLLAVPLYAVLQQQSFFGDLLAMYPVLGAVLLFTAMTPLVFFLGRRQHSESFRGYLFAGVSATAVITLPHYAIKMLHGVIFVPTKNIATTVVYQAKISSSLTALAVVLAVFTLLYALAAVLVAVATDSLSGENFAPFRTPIIRIYVVITALLGLVFLRVENFKYVLTMDQATGIGELKGGVFGPEVLLTLALVVAFVSLSVLFRGEEGRERFKAYFFSGALIYLIVAGSWVFVMCYKHGLRFMKEWFIYHHFQRLQGVIEKPNNSFDLYIKQIGFGMFPWSALIPIAVARLLRWNWKDLLDPKSQRNLFFFCCAFFPYVFFTFSSTKFHHYIFPVVPFLAIIVGVWLSRLFREDGVAKDRLGVGASLLLFVLLAKDLMTNYKPLHQLFTYYTNRTTPAEVYPRNAFIVLFGLFGLMWLSVLLARRLRYTHFGMVMVPVCLFVLYVNVRLVPAVAPNFSFKSLWTTYQKIDDERILKKLNVKRMGALKQTKSKLLRKSIDDAFQQAARNVKNNRVMRRICRSFHRDIVRLTNQLSKGKSKAERLRLRKSINSVKSKFDPCPVLVRKPFAEYANWDERSTSFYSNNFSAHIGKTWKAKPFLRKKDDIYIMVDRYKLPTLQKMAKDAKRKLYILARPNYKMWLVSTKQSASRSNLNSIVLNKAPALKAPHWKRLNITFGDKIRMVGVYLDKPNGYRRGDKVRMIFLFKCLKKMPQSWGVFIHADPVTWTRNRLNWDHLMAEGLYPTNEWKPGQYIQDVVEKRIPRNYPSHYNRLYIYMGLWRGSSRLPIKYSTVYHDGQNRVRPVVIKLLP